MTNAEHRLSAMSDCSFTAQDCKTSADYAAYNFQKGNEAEARSYADQLLDRAQHLHAQLSFLDYANAKIAKDGE